MEEHFYYCYDISWLKNVRNNNVLFDVDFGTVRIIDLYWADDEVSVNKVDVGICKSKSGVVNGKSWSGITF